MTHKHSQKRMLLGCGQIATYLARISGHDVTRMTVNRWLRSGYLDCVHIEESGVRNHTRYLVAAEDLREWARTHSLRRKPGRKKMR